tara:strand:+ start:2902 stop:3903 length:1002 start_codon:yes stop_codon:yes gene_type:complete
MKILVTGGAGFIGSAVIRYLINQTKNEVVNVDKLTYAGNLKALSDIDCSKRYKFEKVDICNNSEISRVFQEHQPDAVMHLAAESHVDSSIKDASIFIQTNIVGTYNLLEVTRNYWKNLKNKEKQSFRFHHVSTDEVFGDLGLTKNLFDEETPYNPSSPYSASKASSDHLVRAWYRTYGIPVIITNCSNNYGPYQYPEKLIPLTIKNALNLENIPIYGKGNQIRDWLYVEDHAHALYAVISKGKVGETYNIGGHNEKKNIEVVKEICQILNELKPASNGISYLDLITFVEDRPGHDIRYAIDANKIEHAIGWKPSNSFSSGLRKTICWYLDNMD